MVSSHVYVDYEGTRKLAETCHMSVGQVSAAKKELIDKELMTKGQRETRGGLVDEFIPVDLWQQNYARFSVQEVNTTVHTVNTNTESVQEVNVSVHTVNVGVQEVNVRKNHEERTNKNNIPRTPPAVQSDHQKLMELYASALPDHRIPNGKQEGSAAKAILAAGYTPDQAIQVYEYLKRRDFWADQHLSLQTVNKQMGAVIAAIKNNKNGYTNGKHIRQSAIGNPERKPQVEADLTDGFG